MKKISKQILEITYPIIYENMDLGEAWSDVVQAAKNYAKSDKGRGWLNTLLTGRDSGKSLVDFGINAAKTLFSSSKNSKNLTRFVESIKKRNALANFNSLEDIKGYLDEALSSQKVAAETLANDNALPSFEEILSASDLDFDKYSTYLFVMAWNIANNGSFKHSDQEVTTSDFVIMDKTIIKNNIWSRGGSSPFKELQINPVDKTVCVNIDNQNKRYVVRKDVNLDIIVEDSLFGSIAGTNLEKALYIISDKEAPYQVNTRKLLVTNKTSSSIITKSNTQGGEVLFNQVNVEKGLPSSNYQFYSIYPALFEKVIDPKTNEENHFIILKGDSPTRLFNTKSDLNRYMKENPEEYVFDDIKGTSVEFLSRFSLINVESSTVTIYPILNTAIMLSSAIRKTPVILLSNEFPKQKEK